MDVRLLIATWPEVSPRGAVTRFCDEHQLSRSWFYEIRARGLEEPVEQVVFPRSRRPTTNKVAVGLEVEDLAVRVRKELEDGGWDHGPLSVRHELQRLGVKAPSRSTLARIFLARGLVTPQPQKRPKSSYKRFTFPAPNACWQIDATEWELLDGTMVVIFQVLDDHSRYELASLAASGETSEDALTVVREALEAFGTPQLVLTDNGAALNPERRGSVGQLATFLRTLGIKPITSRPYHPETCGKNERIHQTLKRYLAKQPRAATLQELQAQLDAFDDYYNHRRPHQALGMRTPAQAWQDTPAAPAPTPPTAQTTPTAPRIELTHPITNQSGKVSIAGNSIHVGFEHRGHRLVALRQGQHLDLFTADGTHVRSLDLEPGKHFYPSGRPRGGTLAMKRSASKTNPTRLSGMS
jgi:transposase InsO family protein